MNQIEKMRMSNEADELALLVDQFSMKLAKAKFQSEADRAMVSANRLSSIGRSIMESLDPPALITAENIVELRKKFP